MDIERVSNDLKERISEKSVILTNEPMSNHTSFRIGGNADIKQMFITASDIMSRSIFDAVTLQNVA